MAAATRDPLQVRWARWHKGVLVLTHGGTGEMIEVETAALKTAAPGLYKSAVRRAMAAKAQEYAGQERRGGDYDRG